MLSFSKEYECKRNELHEPVVDPQWRLQYHAFANGRCITQQCDGKGDTVTINKSGK